MKLDNIKNSDTRFLDDNKQNDVDVSIDSENMGAIISLLTTNLYSNKEASLVREIVSNAWDAHVVAGNDNPILLSFDQDEQGNITLSIRDYGIGLDEEGINAVYKKLGTSTKTNDNNQIGGFGIGKFSALAYAETVEIFSYHEGIKYAYMMFKEGLHIKVPLLYKEETDEPNGLQIRVPIKRGDISSFISGINNQLPYFENLIIENNAKNYDLIKLADDFNEVKIKDFGFFKMNSLSGSYENCSYGDPSILLGKVIYPIDLNYLHKINSNHPVYRMIDKYRTSIGVKFDIGEIKVTPNREELQYDRATAELILERLYESYKFLEDRLNDFSSADIQDLEQYKNVLFNTSIIQIEEGNNDFCFKTVLSDSILSKITCRGIHYPKQFFQKMDTPGYYEFNLPLTTKAKVTSSKFSVNTSSYRSFGYAKIIRNDIETYFKDHFFHSKETFKKMEKEYFKEKCNSSYGNYIYDFPKSEQRFIKEVWYRSITAFKQYIKPKKGSYSSYRNAQTFNEHDVKYIPLIKSYFKEFIIPKLKEAYSSFKDTNEDTIPEAWVKQYKEDAAKNKKKVAGKGIINCDIYRHSMVIGTNSAKTTKDMSIEEISKLNHLVIFGEKNSEEIYKLSELLYGDNFDFEKVNKLLGNKALHISTIAIAKSKMKELEGQVDNVISYEEFMKGENKSFGNLATCLLISEDLGKYEGLSTLLLQPNSLEFGEKYLDKQTFDNITYIIKTLSRYKSMYNHNDHRLRKDMIEIAKRNKILNLGLLNRYKEVRSTMKKLTQISTMKKQILQTNNRSTSTSSNVLDLLILENSMYKKHLKIKPSTIKTLKKTIYG